MKLNEFTKRYREQEGLSQREFAERCNMSHSYISMFEIGKNPSTGKKLVPTGETLKKLASGMRMTVDDLVKQVDDFIVNIQSDYDPMEYGLLPVPQKIGKIPRLGRIHCGDPIMAEENIEGYDERPDGIAADYTLVCEGDSMIEAGIQDGDIVYIRQQPEVENGEIAAVWIDGETTLKRFTRDGDIVSLAPANAKYKTILLTGQQLSSVRILGKAVGFTRFFV